jgi:IclR family transcriptional regulator, acetate operon repressor
MTDTPRDFTPPRSVERVLTIVRTLAQAGQPMSLAELSATLGVPKTSLFALLKGLEQAEYVTFKLDRYALGRESERLARAIIEGRSLVGIARPVLEELGHATRETIILCALGQDRRHVVYVDVIEAESSLRFSVSVGTTRPLNASASGQVVLSFMPAKERERYIVGGEFVRYTPRTVATRSALRAATATARREGCAMTIDGSVDGGIGIAAPLFDQEGSVVGAVVVAAPSTRLIDRVDEIKTRVRASAHAISQRLGYAGKYPP